MRVTNPVSAVPRQPAHAPGTGAQLHRGVHGAGYGFMPPYTEISVPRVTAPRARNPYTNQYFSRYLRTRPAHTLPR
jgi:hypothetical protein